MGADDYVAKPFSKAEFKGVIKRAAEVAAAGLAAPAAGESIQEKAPESEKSFVTIGDKSWMVLQEDGSVLLGVKRSFLHAMGKVQTVFLPSRGEKLRQGSVCVQFFSSDMRAHTCVTPLSGTIIDINEKVAEKPDLLLEDPYDEGWLVKLEPDNYEYEIKTLGL